MQFLIGVVVGALAGALYYSEQGRQEVQQRLSAAQTSLQQASQSTAAAVAGGAQKLGSAIDTTPLPAQVKDVAGRATSAIRSTAESLGQKPDGGEGQPDDTPSAS
jgi:hypothetical protein